MKELDVEEPFEVLPGCPTVCFNVGEQATMLPWSAFGVGRFSKCRVELEFGDLVVVIIGASLEGLWRFIQLQDVRELQAGGGAGAIQVESITISDIRRLQDGSGENPLREADGHPED